MPNKQGDKTEAKQPQREPISLAPLGFEEALSDLLKTGPHPKEQDAPQEGTTKPLPQKKQRRGSKPTDTD
ncbi:MAG TPA: hypothetical protein VGE04_04905 [Chloroflexia bacterium]|jgi:hypothetical protein